MLKAVMHLNFRYPSRSISSLEISIGNFLSTMFQFVFAINNNVFIMCFARTVLRSNQSDRKWPGLSNMIDYTISVMYEFVTLWQEEIWPGQYNSLLKLRIVTRSDGRNCHQQTQLLSVLSPATQTHLL